MPAAMSAHTLNSSRLATLPRHGGDALPSLSSHVDHPRPQPQQPGSHGGSYPEEQQAGSHDCGSNEEAQRGKAVLRVVPQGGGQQLTDGCGMGAPRGECKGFGGWVRV